MLNLKKDIARFLLEQHFTIVSTVDKSGLPHNSCKGIVSIDGGKIYMLDLYTGRTHDNLERDPKMSVTAVDEHRFKGYCLKGTAKLVKENGLKPHIIKAWEAKMTSRISHRLIKNIRGEAGHKHHPEAMMPKPKYLIEMTVKEIIDLAPPLFR